MYEVPALYLSPTKKAARAVKRGWEREDESSGARRGGGGEKTESDAGGWARVDDVTL